LQTKSIPSNPTVNLSRLFDQGRGLWRADGQTGGPSQNGDVAPRIRQQFRTKVAKKWTKTIRLGTPQV